MTKNITYPFTQKVRSLLVISIALVSLTFYSAVLLSAQHPGKYSLGAALSKEIYQNIAKGPPLSRGDYNLPSRISLKNYTPAVGNQGGSGSCVGWASAYAARTLAEKRQKQLSIPTSAFSEAFSPAYIFNQIKTSKNSCEGGSTISEALSIMSTQGVLPALEFPYSDASCDRLPTIAEKISAASYKIKTYRRIASWDSVNQHIPIRRALASGHPVVIGMLVGETFMKHEGGNTISFTAEDRRLVTSKRLDRSIKLDDYGGHALTVIGYDDAFNGGSLEVMNSWGDDWGNDGYFWITYEDFNIFNREGYELIPFDPIKPKAKPDFGGSASFIHLSDKKMPYKTSVEKNGASLLHSYPSGTRFRVEISSKATAFVYVIGGDNSGEKFVKLFPRNNSISPVVNAGNTLLMPGPTEDYFSRMNDTVGKDSYIILLSKQALDLEQVLNKFNQSPCCNSLSRLENALGSKLVKASDVTRKSSSEFIAVSKDDSVIAHIVTMDHIHKGSIISDRAAPKIVITEPKQDKEAWLDGEKDVRTVTSNSVVLVGLAQDLSQIQEITSEQAYEVKFSSRGGFRLKIDLTNKTLPLPIVIKAVDVYGNASEQIVTLKK